MPRYGGALSALFAYFGYKTTILGIALQRLTWLIIEVWELVFQCAFCDFRHRDTFYGITLYERYKNA